MSGPAASGYSVAYGALQEALASLCDIAPSVVQARFRNLRLRDFPDAIQNGKGVRVRYDLPRALAVSAVFALGDGALPQLSAADLVAATWPEWCRAFIAAAVGRELIAPPKGMPSGVMSALSIAPSGFAANGRHLAVAANDDGAPPSGLPLLCMLRLDVAAILEALDASSSNEDGLADATSALAATFGWTRPELPHREDVANMPPLRGFLDDGPYFERALALLDCPSDVLPGPIAGWRLKILSDYLQRPAPIDAWKAEIGHDEGAPRLHHLLTSVARDLGVPTLHVDPDTLAACAGGDVRAIARDMIARAQSRRGTATTA